MIAMPMEGQETMQSAAEGESPETGEVQASGDERVVGGQPSMLSTGLLAFGAVVMMLMIFRMLRRSSGARYARQHEAETARETIDRHRTEALASREPLTTMMAEADELARRLANMLDNKAARLEALLSEANDRIAMLEQHGGASNGRATGTESPLRISADSVEERVYALADDGHDSVQIARRVGRGVAEVDLILALRR